MSVGRSLLLHRTFLVVHKISTPFLRHFRVEEHRDILIYDMVGCVKNYVESSVISLYEEIRRYEIGIFSVDTKFHKDNSFLIYKITLYYTGVFQKKQGVNAVLVRMRKRESYPIHS